MKVGEMSNNYVVGRPQKSYLVALLLSVFLGGLGIDRFYLGHIGLGVAKLLLCWATLGIWWIIDVILIAMRKVDSSQFRWDDEPSSATDNS
jgi:TM2 domain-containing membrane protein YozV